MCKLKKCCKCSLDKSVSEFSKNKAKKDETKIYESDEDLMILIDKIKSVD